MLKNHPILIKFNILEVSSTKYILIFYLKYLQSLFTLVNINKIIILPIIIKNKNSRIAI